MSISRKIALVLASYSIYGCSAFSPSEVVEPSSVTIDTAMRDIGIGFKNLKEELTKGDELKLGLWPCKVTVTLNVTASADQGGKLVIDAGVKPTVADVNPSVGVNASQENKSSASRGNTVSIDMYSTACIPNNTLGYDKPDKVKTVGDALSDVVGRGPFKPGAPFSGTMEIDPSLLNGPHEDR